MKKRFCKKCGSKDLYQGRVCKECRSKLMKKYYNANKKDYERRFKKFRNRNLVRMRKYNLMSRYKITPEDYAKLFKRQKGLCAISKMPLEAKGNKTCLDHDHGTKVIRGLITQKLNFALGLFGDDPKLLRAAAKYLEEFQ